MTKAQITAVVALATVAANVVLALSGTTAQVSCTVARIFAESTVASTTQ